MRIKNLFFNLIIVAMCVLLLISGGFFFLSLHDYMSAYHIEGTSLLYAIQDEDYGRLVELAKRSQAAENEPTKIQEECYAVAAYFEAASYYKAYLLAGENEKAEKKAGIMEEQMEQMGEFSYLAEEICKRLELEIR
ncbi:MAG: hypothetical protein IJP31_09320 [Lachnospiraceae bacterium]|nr:hypothetical protein [Lachnospiraceae bacterium]